jgi:hypothetical protein
MEQREGRAVRLGSAHREVEVVVFRPPPAVERALRITETLAAKARLPGRVGLGTAGRGLWRWRSEVAEAYREGEARCGTAMIPGASAGVLAGFELFGIEPGAERRLASALIWVEPDGGWTDEEGIMAARLADAATAAPAAPDSARLGEALSLVAGPVRSRLTLARGSRWAAPPADPVVHRLSLRLHQCIREAARRRDLDELAAVEEALAFVGRGHTAGESAAMERLAAMTSGEFAREVLRLPRPVIRHDTIEARLSGLLLFVPA